MASIFDQARAALKNLKNQAVRTYDQNFGFDQGRFNAIAQIKAATQLPQQQALQYRQQVDQLVPRLNVAQNVQNPYLKFGAEVGQGLVNVFPNAVAGAAKLPAARNFQQRAADVASIVEAPLSLTGFGVAKNIGLQGLKQAGFQGLKQTAKQGTKTGAIYGGIFGGTAGLREGEYDSLGGQLGKTALGIGTGAALGGVTGGLLSGAGYSFGTVVNAIKRAFPKAPEPQLKRLAQKFIRDEAGRFAKGPSKKKEPVYYGDIRESLGLPRSGDYQLPQPGLSIKYVKNKGLEGGGGIASPKSTELYIKELTRKQKQAGSSETLGFKQKAGSFLAEVKAKLVDETSPITDVLTSAEKKLKFQTLPSQDIRLQIDRVLRSKNLASQFAEDNGLVNVIKKAPDLDALDQYMIAKQAASVEKQGIKTGRDLTRDQQLIQDLAPQYEAFAQEVNQYSRKLLDYSVQTGLIDKKLATELVKKYPDYVPLNRVFNELEKPTFRGTGKGVASLSKQTVVQKLKGSEREITSPIESLLLKTQDAFSQGERNIAAKQLASYKNLPGFEGLMKEVDAGARAPHTFSYIENGVKKTFATTPEIEAAAKSLNVEQMGILGKILSTPTRVLQLGATGLNIPFVVTNIAKDEITGLINSNRAMKTSILNPANYVKALLSAVKHDELYKDLIRSAGGGTSFDIAREAPNLAVQKIRNPIKYTVRHPLELLRAVENIVGRSEELGRIKNYAGMRQALIQEGRTLQDSNLLAAQAARENTANFARRGSFGRVINWMIPFFNAGIQGSRQLVRSFQNNPTQTSFKVATTIFTPIAVATAWNLSDPERKKIYEDIPSYEKENNIIIIPPDVTRDAKGKYNVIKLPLPPGLSNLGTIVRRSLETAEGLNPVSFGEIATNLITAGTSVDITSGNKLASTFTPQLVKPVVEATTNTNLFTGQQIVPDYMKNQLPENQVKAGTSPVAVGIGKALNTSPLMVENFAQTQLGGLGSQLLGKETAVSNLQKRFTKASGGDLLDKVYDDSAQVQAINSNAKKLLEAGKKEEALKLIKDNKAVLSKASQVKVVKSEVDKLQEYKNKVRNDPRLTQEQKDKVLMLIQKKLYELSTVYSSVK